MATNGGHPEKRRKDPLVLLREAVSEGVQVALDGDHLALGRYRFHRNTKCAYRLSPKAPFVDIGSVWYMLHVISSGNRSYTKDLTKKRGFVYIGVANRSDLVDYLTGRAETCIGLVLDVIEGRKRIKNQPAPKLDGPANKRAKTDGDAAVAEGDMPDASEVAEALNYSDVASRVRPVKDLKALVRCPGKMVPNADRIIEIAQEEYQNWHGGGAKASTSKADSKPVPGKVPLHQELEEILRKDEKALPIILVPCSKTAPVNMLNVHKLLQNGVYEKLSLERLRFFEAMRPECVQVARNINGKTWSFEVRDSIAGFTTAHWMRTVCVISDSTDWQFKGWPFKTCVDIFTTMRGIFFQAPGTLCPVHLANWSVTILPMSAHHLEHRASHLRDKLFDALEDHMMRHRARKFSNSITYVPDKRIIEKPKPVL